MQVVQKLVASIFDIPLGQIINKMQMNFVPNYFIKEIISASFVKDEQSK